MSALTELARGKQCHLRLPEFCRRDTEHTVLMHIRRGNAGGMGLKPCDLLGAPGCDRCHAVYDGQHKQKIYDRDVLDAEMLRAHCEWVQWLWKHEIVLVALPR